MGWEQSTEVMCGLIEIAQEFILDEDMRREYYKKTIRLLEVEESNWSCILELKGEDDAFDEAVDELRPFNGEDWRDDYPDEA